MTTYSWFTAEERASWPSEHKKCRGCREVLPFSAFHKHKQALFGYANKCKECRKPTSKQNYSKQSWEYKMWYRARARSRENGREFTIQLEDIVIPSECPILKRPFVFVANSPWVPSLDRIDPSRGYTPDNIMVISSRANTLKNNASKEEARLLADWMEANCNWTIVRC
ncbi:endonuclease [Streptomyces phage Jay2Jay]|uniref:HNH endonuclease n=1 Tax=Streptomyces phage Jay2Jay TaxID=1556290 RepID=A0A0A0RKR9_9CAUD|nr:endonuclease [Streptomyces phage Jay2Jay]AIW02546.1 HNH endonuclease [Streptomyces phage Jay2Jay]